MKNSENPSKEAALSECSELQICFARAGGCSIETAPSAKVLPQFIVFIAIRLDELFDLLASIDKRAALIDVHMPNSWLLLVSLKLRERICFRK